MPWQCHVISYLADYQKHEIVETQLQPIQAQIRKRKTYPRRIEYPSFFETLEK